MKKKKKKKNMERKKKKKMRRKKKQEKQNKKRMKKKKEKTSKKNKKGKEWEEGCWGPCNQFSETNSVHDEFPRSCLHVWASLISTAQVLSCFVCSTAAQSQLSKDLLWNPTGTGCRFERLRRSLCSDLHPVDIVSQLISLSADLSSLTILVCHPSAYLQCL